MLPKAYSLRDDVVLTTKRLERVAQEMREKRCCRIENQSLKNSGPFRWTPHFFMLSPTRGEVHSGKQRALP